MEKGLENSLVFFQRNGYNALMDLKDKMLSQKAS